MLLLHTLGFLLKSKPVRQDCLLFVPGYAALTLVTSYAAPWLRHVRVSLGSLQTWWSWRAAKEHAGSNQALRSTVDSRQPVCGDYSASVRFIKIPARFTCDLVDFAMAMLKATALGVERAQVPQCHSHRGWAHRCMRTYLPSPWC